MGRDSDLTLARSGQTAAVAAFARSEVFARLFARGLDLTDRAAAYLDGPGRKEALRLERQAAEAYAQLSLSLSWRLQQLASWLCIYRAVADAALSPAAALDERHRRVAEEGPVFANPAAALPTALLALRDELAHLEAQVRRHDLDLRAAGAQRTPQVLLQLRRLERAYPPAPQVTGATSY